MARFEVTVSEMQSAANKISQAAENFLNVANQTFASAQALADSWEGDSQVAFQAEQQQADRKKKRAARSTGAHTCITLRASGNDRMPTDCRNLAWRAAEKYLVRVGLSGEVSITIEKHIPMAAGLAGGSADEAAVLRGLNHICGERLSLDELCELGATLGADIPFCLVGGGARVTGIGERLASVAPMPQTVLAVACMGEGVSTPWAYGKLDELYGGFADAKADDARPDRILSSLATNDIFAACVDFYNIFEDVVPSVQPYVDRIKDVMQKNGAIRAMMSGSGPSVFGVFDSVEAAGAAVEELRAMGASAFVCHPTAKYS